MPETSVQAVIPVVAAVIRRGERFLVCQRPFEKRHGGLWEFPGGKRAPDETVEMAVARELEEELNVRTLSVQPAIFEVRDPKSPFVITFFPVEIEGEPAQLEHAAVAWVAARDLPFLALAPSDARFVDAVVAPRRP